MASRRTLAAAYDRSRNNFDALRFLLAILVLWSHAYSLDAELDPFLAVSGGQMSAGAVGVEDFFVVSGFLRRRLPGPLVATAVGVVLVGPRVTTQSWSAYFASPRRGARAPARSGVAAGVARQASSVPNSRSNSTNVAP